jgi:hypothetical protein
MRAYHVVMPAGKLRKAMSGGTRALRWLLEHVRIPLHSIAEETRQDT